MRIGNRIIPPHEKGYKASDDRYTPLWIFEVLDMKFDLDVAAPHSRPTSNPTQWFCKCCCDGLTNKWVGNVWMNPPFSGVSPWVSKFITHANGIALLPMGKTKWLNNMWDLADGIVMLPSSLKFIVGNKQESISTQTALFAFGDANVEALKRIGKVR